MTTQTEVNPLDELDFEPAKTCECMLVADDGTRATTTYRWGHLTRRDTFTTRD